MNNIQFELLKRIKGEAKLNPVVLDDMLKNYLKYNEKLNFHPFLEDQQFKSLFKSIYSVLGLRITDTEFALVADNYIRLLLADQRDGCDIDINWIIDHVWYLCMGSSYKKLISKYKDDISFLQEKLIEEYGVQENIKEKISRKVYTKYMTNV